VGRPGVPRVARPPARAGRRQRAEHLPLDRASRAPAGPLPYAEHGLFDRTHLRFFTRTSARELVASAGLRVVAERFAPAPLPLQAHVPALRRLEAGAARAWPALFALQVVLVGERA
jgi:hypothetical protein